MKKTSLLFMLLACLAAPALAVPDDAVKKMFEQSVATSDVAKRRSLRLKIAQTSPASAYGLISKAYLLSEGAAPNRIQIIGLYSEAIKLDPGIEVAYYNRGLSYLDIGKTSSAIADFSKAIEMRGDYTDAYCGRADAYKLAGEKDLALADYAKALKLDPKHVLVYVNRGHLYYTLKEYQKAIADFSAAILLAPGAYEGYLNRCGTYHEIGEYDKALSDCDKAVELEPESPMPYVTRGSVYISMGLWDKARADREKSVEQMPDEETYWNSLGYIYVQEYNYKKAMACYNKALSLAPGYSVVYHNLCDLYISTRQYQQALDTADYLLKKSPEYAPATVFKGAVMSAMGKPLEAISYFDKAIAAGKEEEDLLLARAEAYTDAGKDELAIADATAAKKKYGYTMSNRLTSARIMHRFGAKKEAALSFYNTYRQAPKSLKKLRKEVELKYGYYSDKKLADLEVLLAQYDAYARSAEIDANEAAAEKTSSAPRLAQDQCFCLYYTGQQPPYYISQITPPWPGCEKLRLTPETKANAVKVLKNCADLKKGS